MLSSIIHVYRTLASVSNEILVSDALGRMEANWVGCTDHQDLAGADRQQPYDTAPVTHLLDGRAPP